MVLAVGVPGGYPRLEIRDDYLDLDRGTQNWNPHYVQW